MSSTDSAPASTRNPVPAPSAAPATTTPALLLGLALLTLGALCIRELIIYAEVVDSEPWLANTAVWIAQLQWRSWMMGAAPAAILAGLVLLIAALKPRRRTHVALRSEADIWLRPTDIARLCSAAAFEEPDVLTAVTTVTKAQATVAVTAARPSPPNTDDRVQSAPTPEFDARAADLRERVSARVTTVVAELAAPLAVRITVLPGATQAPDQHRRVI